MQITNRLNLPQPFVAAVSSEYKFKPDHYSVTSLLKGTREILLERRHSSEISQDVSDMIWLILGTAVHSIIERAQTGEHEIKEGSVRKTVDERVITGRFDLYDSNLKKIVDYKTCSVWKVICGNFEDWERQLMLYAYLMRSVDMPVEKVEIVAIMKDHNKNRARYKSNYPTYPVSVITFEVTEKKMQDIESWLKFKIKEIKNCEQMEDNQLPLCTAEERYNRPKYAVMKAGQKAAVRVFEEEQEMLDWKQEHDHENYYIEKRNGVDAKCLDYCSAAPFCAYYQMLKGGRI